MENPKITSIIANHVLRHFDDENYIEAGSFHAILYKAMDRASEESLSKLALGFPAEVGAYKIRKFNERGEEVLKDIAKGRTTATVFRVSEWSQ